MRNDFAIFILSHGRANDMTTIDAIKKAGYTGKWHIIVDDLDDQKDKYIEKYGDRVIVFDKKAWAERTDTVTSTGELRSVVFARNACYEIAEGLGLKYFAEFDDDLFDFYFRYNENGKLKGKPITNIDDVIESMIEFQETANLAYICFASAGGLIGGINGRWSQKLLRGIYQAFILRVDKPIEFKGILNEDCIATEWCNSTGLLGWQICELVQSSPVRSTNKGGLHDLYMMNDEYIRAFYSIIAFPNNLKIMEWRGKIVISRKKETLYPMILSERWKKGA